MGAEIHEGICSRQVAKQLEGKLGGMYFTAIVKDRLALVAATVWEPITTSPDKGKCVTAEFLDGSDPDPVGLEESKRKTQRVDDDTQALLDQCEWRPLSSGDGAIPM
jgi:hypothetical protein